MKLTSIFKKVKSVEFNNNTNNNIFSIEKNVIKERPAYCDCFNCTYCCDYVKYKPNEYTIKYTKLKDFENAALCEYLELSKNKEKILEKLSDFMISNDIITHFEQVRENFKFKENHKYIRISIIKLHMFLLDLFELTFDDIIKARNNFSYKIMDILRKGKYYYGSDKHYTTFEKWDEIVREGDIGFIWEAHKDYEINRPDWRKRPLEEM